jgi:pyruvyltransferase
MDLPKGWRLILPERPVQQVIAEISECELIVSSSLHGLITADSLGIECVWLRTSKPLYGASEFKFHDYESARQAPLNDPISYEQLSTTNVQDLASIATEPDRPIDEWQAELVAAFPFR